MKVLDLTLDTPAQNVALDEALLEEAEARTGAGEVLRLWEPSSPFVVIGRSSKVDVEVNRESCDADDVPYLRRCSGGAAIVAGPGCLMYAVVLSYEKRPELRVLDQAHAFVLSNVRSALLSLDLPVSIQGTSDLVIDDLKFSGNSLRCKRRHFLYHGTLLYNFPLDQITTYLNTPPRQPDYRRQRPHRLFVTNLNTTSESLRHSLQQQWQANESRVDWPQTLTQELATNRYGTDDWNLRH